MNSLFVLLDIESWKPILTALLLPPVPLLLMVLVGARLLLPSRGLGWLVILLSVTLLWLSACSGTGQWLSRMLLQPPPAIGPQRIAELKALAQTRQPVAIVVLGGGVEPYAPEYALSNLLHPSLERLRYGLWLGRETGLPVAFSGGVGWGLKDSVAEAQVAARVAAQDFGRPLRWVEDASRDTRENGANSVALLRQDGVKHVLLVTHGWHMKRSVRAFERAAGGEVRIEAAPMGLASEGQTSALSWLPSGSGAMRVRNVLRELAGLGFGA
ncbi:MAG: hypothetical protein AD742_20580 [Methylibium sp. NZG]|nr:MAG: hypothetical protein AD742_20580 [Methylibium sp. NZG]